MALTPLSTPHILLGRPDYPRRLFPCPVSNRRLRGHVRCSASIPPPPPRWNECRSSRRSASVALLLLLHCCSAHPDRAGAANPFDKYVKRKKLDPLEAYVPAVLLTQAQFKDLEKTLDFEQPKYDIGRSLLRSGPAGSLRVNIRAVAQYATDEGKGEAASDAVDRCLRALEELDSLLLRASRNDRTASVESMRSNITVAIGALDRTPNLLPCYCGVALLSLQHQSQRVHIQSVSCKPCHQRCWTRARRLRTRIGSQVPGANKASPKTWTQT